jgi:hypothetical protein
VSRHATKQRKPCSQIINTKNLSFSELYSLVTKSIRNRIGQAKSVFNKMKNFLCNKHVSLQTRKHVVQTYVKSVMCYGCEVWTINKRIQSQLEAAEMWFLRRMMKVPWTAKTSNEIILMRAKETRTLIKDIRKRQSIEGDNGRRFWMV